MDRNTGSLTSTCPALASVQRREARFGIRADRRIVEAPVETDPAERRFALRDADAEAEVVTGVPPALGQRADPGLHVERHAHGALGVVGAGHRVVEEDEKAVAEEALERALVGEDQRPRGGVILGEDRHHLVGLAPSRRRR